MSVIYGYDVPPEESNEVSPSQVWDENEDLQERESHKDQVVFHM